MQIIIDAESKKLIVTRKYIKELLHRFYMDKPKVVSKPVGMDLKLSAIHCPPSDSEKEYTKKVSFSLVVCFFMHAIVYTT